MTTSDRSAQDGPTDYPAMPLGTFLDAVAARQPAPGAGAAVAVTAAMAAGLVAMAAGFSEGRLADAASLRDRADALRAKLAPLPQQDGAAYAEVLRASALPRARPDRRELVQRALSAASEVPMELARVAAEVTRLAGDLAERGNPRLLGEVVTARLLATAAVHAAAALVEEDLSDKTDPRIAEARALVASVGHGAPGAVGPA